MVPPTVQITFVLAVVRNVKSMKISYIKTIIKTIISDDGKEELRGDNNYIARLKRKAGGLIKCLCLYRATAVLC